MNKLERAKLRIQPEDYKPRELVIGKEYKVAWASKKYKNMRVELISYRNNRCVVRTSREKLIVMDTSDLLIAWEKEVINNAKKRKNKNNKRRKLNF